MTETSSKTVRAGIAAIPLLSDQEEAALQAAIAQDPDNPELTDEQIAQMRPAREALPPALYAALTRRRPKVGDG
ncbi:hypothetical protein [Methylobacterium sp. NFXW15]|uniref:hypothetical protein n=1 Tax=Methylobacterium sp. NFXW15 TaxID=2819512 RepID=UPI003CF34A19